MPSEAPVNEAIEVVSKVQGTNELEYRIAAGRTIKSLETIMEHITDISKVIDDELTRRDFKDGDVEIVEITVSNTGIFKIQRIMKIKGVVYYISVKSNTNMPDKSLYTPFFYSFKAKDGFQFSRSSDLTENDMLYNLPEQTDETPTMAEVQEKPTKKQDKEIDDAIEGRVEQVGENFGKNIGEKYSKFKGSFVDNIEGKNTREVNTNEEKPPPDKPIQVKEVENTNAPASRVDENIPLTGNQKNYTYALIIGNEDYQSYQMGLSNEVNVAYAANDAKIFKAYCEKTLGVPEKNIMLLIDARAIDMHRAVDKLSLLAKNAQGKAEIIFYFAGHGLPDETTQEPHLIPVDVSGKDLKFAIPLKDLYTKLNEYQTKRVTVFLDACFSGGARSQGLVEARAVKVKPKESQPEGNMVVFSASSGEQSSLPYKDQQHGIFTYYLLKKLQETKGDINYGELADYLTEEVSINSLLINDKEQNPQVNVSPAIQEIWKAFEMK